MLQKIKIAPGFNKQVTATGGEGQWVSGDYVRFRYGSPEKIGGWAQLGDNTLTGRNTALHHFVNASGIKYAALGTNRMLYVYSGCELEHWREPFEGKLCGQVFLHYNHANGPFAKTNLYDKRPLLGVPKTR